MPGPSRRRRARKGERFAVRYAFYGVLLLLVALMFVFGGLYNDGIISYSNFIALASIAQSLLFAMIAVCYMLFRKMRLGQIVRGLGLKRSALSARNIGIGVLLFGAVLLVELGIGLFSSATGVQLPTNVQQVLGSLPLYFIVFSVLVAPVNEEILFRGFLVPRWGIIISAAVFGALHYVSYLSISELLAAFVFGLLAGYIRKRTDSIYPTIAAHMLVNLLAVLALASM